MALRKRVHRVIIKGGCDNFVDWGPLWLIVLDTLRIVLR
jgi:hypothetical protein